MISSKRKFLAELANIQSIVGSPSTSSSSSSSFSSSAACASDSFPCNSAGEGSQFPTQFPTRVMSNAVAEYTDHDRIASSIEGSQLPTQFPTQVMSNAVAEYTDHDRIASSIPDSMNGPSSDWFYSQRRADMMCSYGLRSQTIQGVGENLYSGRQNTFSSSYNHNNLETKRNNSQQLQQRQQQLVMVPSPYSNITLVECTADDDDKTMGDIEEVDIFNCSASTRDLIRALAKEDFKNIYTPVRDGKD